MTSISEVLPRKQTEEDEPMFMESLSGTSISHFIACKSYEEKKAIHMCRAYNDVFSRERELNQQQVQKRILLVDDDYDVGLVMKLVLEKTALKLIHLLMPLKP